MRVKYIDFSKFKYRFQISDVLIQFPLMKRVHIPEARSIFIQWLKSHYPNGLSVGQINALLRVTDVYNSVNEAWRENAKYYKDRNDFFDNAVIKKVSSPMSWTQTDISYLVINVKLLKEPLASRPYDPFRKALSERAYIKRKQRCLFV